MFYPFKKVRDFLIWISFAVSLYVINCIFVTGMSDVPWIERGLHFSISGLTLIVWLLFPVIDFIYRQSR
jgi:hypothetical protein